MKIILAKTAGFCMGVKRAMDIALKSSEAKGARIYTLGPLIHNEQAVAMLREKNIVPLDEGQSAEPTYVVIRAHGVAPKTAQELVGRGFEIVDATCPHVKRSQERIKEYGEKGWRVVIVGDKDHAEVAGLKGFCPAECAVVSSVEEAEVVELGERVAVVAQTTFVEETYGKIVDVIKKRAREVAAFQTICRATRERQDEVLELAGKCDAVIVVGGKHSANTARLAQLARQKGVPAFHVETAEELDLDALGRFAVVGVTAGASTPSWITRGVIERLESVSGEAGRHLLRRALDGLVVSNMYSSVAAIALAFACSFLQGITFNFRFLVIAFCYIYATSILNRIFEESEDKLHIPTRVRFYRRHSAKLVAISFVLIIASLALGLALRWEVAVFLVVAYGLGVMYSVRLVPLHVGRLSVRRLKDIPGSKDIFSALGWTAIVVFVPFLSARGFGGEYAAALLVGAVAFIVVIVKSVLVDLADIYSDRRIGRETLPVFLGPVTTNVLLVALAGLRAGIFLWGGGRGLFVGAGRERAAYALLISPAYILLTIILVRGKRLKSETMSILAADGNLLILGLTCAAYGALGRL
jgi:4-hydroxy-3-methylbut-2-enyl diphosphate reductase